MDALPQLSDEEFEQIEEAIARTAKGRAFLRRFHRRAMGAATEEIRTILVDFRKTLREQAQAVEHSKHVEVLRRELLEMAASIEQARREVAALRPPDGASDKILSATNELDAIVISTERASFDILNAAERLFDFSAKLRAAGVDPGLCGDIEAEVTNIFTACSFQDLTGQRTSKVVNALRYIEQRVNAMIGIWGEEGLKDVQTTPSDIVDTRPDAHLLNGPALDGQGINQADVDSMFDSPMPAAPQPQPPSVEAKPVQSQADIDSLFDAPAPPSAPAPPPAPAKAMQSQADIDSLFDSPAPPAAPAKTTQSQADIDSMFDAPVKPAAAPPPAKPKPAAAKPATPPKAAPPKPAAKPAPVAADAGGGAAPPPLDQAAIDALFG